MSATEVRRRSAAARFQQARGVNRSNVGLWSSIRAERDHNDTLERSTGRSRHSGLVAQLRAAVGAAVRLDVVATLLDLRAAVGEPFDLQCQIRAHLLDRVRHRLSALLGQLLQLHRSDHGVGVAVDGQVLAVRRLLEQVHDLIGGTLGHVSAIPVEQDVRGQIDHRLIAMGRDKHLRRTPRPGRGLGCNGPVEIILPADHGPNVTHSPPRPTGDSRLVQLHSIGAVPEIRSGTLHASPLRLTGVLLLGRAHGAR